MWEALKYLGGGAIGFACLFVVLKRVIKPLIEIVGNHILTELKSIRIALTRHHEQSSREHQGLEDAIQRQAKTKKK